MNLNPLSSQPALLVLSTMLLMGSAQATDIRDPDVDGSNVINASSVRVDGTVFHDGSSANVWTVNAFGGAGECLRFDITSADPSFRLRLVVISPDGTVYDNGRPATSDLRPQVKIGTAPTNGWYTVHVADFDGRIIEGNFSLVYGRYPAGNVNCTEGSGPTTPAIPS